MGSTTSLQGKTIFVTGGSSGLGKATAKALAARGAHITIFSRRQGPLDEARREIQAVSLSPAQEINAVSIDLANAEEVSKVFRAQSRIADGLYCVAGGNHADNGFLVDLDASALENCMRNNYYSAAFSSKAMLDIWTEDDAKKGPRGLVPGTNPHPPQRRRIVFVSSAAAFLDLPGSIAYTPAKCAVRALADTLRMEVLRYTTPGSQYSIHCAFPGDFLSPGFYLEQDTKTTLTKRMQGLAGVSIADLESKLPSSDEVAANIIKTADKGDFIICKGSLSVSLLFTNMVGPSPKRGWGIVDSLLGVVVGWLVWPILRRRWDAMCRKDGEEVRNNRLVWEAIDPGFYDYR